LVLKKSKSLAVEPNVSCEFSTPPRSNISNMSVKNELDEKSFILSMLQNDMSPRNILKENNLELLILDARYYYEHKEGRLRTSLNVCKKSVADYLFKNCMNLLYRKSFLRALKKLSGTEINVELLNRLVEKYMKYLDCNVNTYKQALLGQNDSKRLFSNKQSFSLNKNFFCDSHNIDNFSQENKQECNLQSDSKMLEEDITKDHQFNIESPLFTRSNREIFQKPYFAEPNSLKFGRNNSVIYDSDKIDFNELKMEKKNSMFVNVESTKFTDETDTRMHKFSSFGSDSNGFKRAFGQDITAKFQIGQDQHKSLFNKSSGKDRTFINELHNKNEDKSNKSDLFYDTESEQSPLQSDFDIFNFACDTCPKIGAACTCLTTP